MRINYEKILGRQQDHKIDKELLKNIEYNEILLIISKTILDYREKNELKQEDLAKKLNITQVMVSKIESGRYNFSIKFLVNLWNTLSDENCNFGEILLKEIYNKVNKNYSRTIEVDNDITPDDYCYKFNKKEITYNVNGIQQYNEINNEEYQFAS